MMIASPCLNANTVVAVAGTARPRKGGQSESESRVAFNSMHVGSGPEGRGLVRSVGGYSVLAQEPPRCEHLTVDSAEGDADAQSRSSETDTLLVQPHATKSPTRMKVPPLQVNSLTLVLYLVGSSVPWLGQNDAGTRYSTPDCSQIVHGCVASLLAPSRGGIASAAIMRRE